MKLHVAVSAILALFYPSKQKVCDAKAVQKDEAAEKENQVTLESSKKRELALNVDAKPQEDKAPRKTPEEAVVVQDDASDASDVGVLSGQEPISRELQIQLDLMLKSQKRGKRGKRGKGKGGEPRVCPRIKNRIIKLDIPTCKGHACTNGRPDLDKMTCVSRGCGYFAFSVQLELGATTAQQDIHYCSCWGALGDNSCCDMKQHGCVGAEFKGTSYYFEDPGANVNFPDYFDKWIEGNP